MDWPFFKIEEDFFEFLASAASIVSCFGRTEGHALDLCVKVVSLEFFTHTSKLYIPSTLNIDLILWHTQLIVCAENIKSWVFPFTFKAYIMPHTLYFMCVSLFRFHV